MIGLLGSLALVLTQQTPVFLSRVAMVYVDVFVTKKDAPVAGLQPADFRVQDNGVDQQVEVVDRAVVPTTAVLVLDTSASVEGGRFVHLKEAARAFLAGLGESDEAALVTFNEKAVLRQDATREVQSVAAALDRVKPRGGTALIDALYLALKKRCGTGRPLVLLFTDGQDSASWLDNEDVVEAARESSALLHVVGTESVPPRLSAAQLPPSLRTELAHAQGSVSNEDQRVESGYVHLLRRAAETTGGAYWPVPSTTNLPAVFRRIVDVSAARYILRYDPTGVPRSGRHRIKVSVRGGGVDVRARQEYVIASAPGK